MVPWWHVKTSRGEKRERIYGKKAASQQFRGSRELSRKLAPPFIHDFLWFLTISHCHVPLHVQGKMVWPRKGTFTQSALERSVSRMFSGMSGQLVRSGEFPPTAFPSTDVGLLARMCPLVSFQVTGFGVGFGAAFLRTMVNDSFALGPRSALSRFGNFSCFG